MRKLICIILIFLFFNVSCSRDKIIQDNTDEPEIVDSTSNIDTSEKADERNINKGLELYKQGRYEEALTIYDNLLKKYPGDYRLWTYKGLALSAIKRCDEGIECYNKALELNKKDPLIWHYKGLALMQLKNPKKAIKCFEKAIEVDPDYVRTNSEIMVPPKTPIPITPTPTDIPLPRPGITPTFPYDITPFTQATPG